MTDRPSQNLIDRGRRFTEASIGAALELSAGEYTMNALELDSQGRLILHVTQGAVILFVTSRLTLRGGVQVIGSADDVLVVYLGAQESYLESPVPGTAIAPAASLVLGTGDKDFVGRYFARAINVRAGIKWID